MKNKKCLSPFSLLCDLDLNLDSCWFVFISTDIYILILRYLYPWIMITIIYLNIFLTLSIFILGFSIGLLCPYLWYILSIFFFLKSNLWSDSDTVDDIYHIYSFKIWWYIWKVSNIQIIHTQIYSMSITHTMGLIWDKF